MKKRPDWIETVRRREAADRWRERERERRQQERKKLKEMTADEMETLVAEIREAVATVQSLVDETKTAEWQAEMRRAKAEFDSAIQDLNAMITKGIEALRRHYAGVAACIPAYDRDGDEFWIFFDGHDLYCQNSEKRQPWRPWNRATLVMRTGLPRAFPALRSALHARRWMAPEPLCTGPTGGGCTFNPQRTKPAWELQGLPNPRNKSKPVSVAHPEIHE